MRKHIVSQTPYTDRFYEHIARSSSTSATEIVPRLIEWFRPRSVVDVGCGTGAWLAEFQRRGVTDVLGFDGPWLDKGSLEIPRDLFVQLDLAEPIVVPRRFDLVLSLETAEHLPLNAADRFVESLTALGPLVVFSAAIPHQRGTHHVNEQWPAFWVERFTSHDFVAIDCLRPQLWTNNNVAWWYAQNMVLFVQHACLEQYASLAVNATSPMGTARSLVHPAHYLATADGLNRAEQRADLTQRWCSELLLALPQALNRAVRSRLRNVSSLWTRRR